MRIKSEIDYDPTNQRMPAIRGWVVLVDVSVFSYLYDPTNQ